MIEASTLHKRFGAVVAVDDVSLVARDGCITGLTGPNGAGKTTTMRILYTLLVPDRGHARVDGIDVAARPNAVRARLGVLSDQRGLYNRLSARENVRYYGRLHGMHGAALERRIDELVALLDMRDIADRRAHGFSQGERMKVAIARALVHSPQNLILDEPTGGLDVMSIRALRDVLRRLRDAGSCVLLSSHVMQEVSALCDEVVVILRGRVVASGSPDALSKETGITSLEEIFVHVTEERGA
jgi:sodium transport system ATP-binding protein